MSLRRQPGEMNCETTQSFSPEKISTCLTRRRRRRKGEVYWRGKLQSRFVAFEIISVIKFVGSFFVFLTVELFNVGGAARSSAWQSPSSALSSCWRRWKPDCSLALGRNWTSFTQNYSFCLKGGWDIRGNTKTCSPTGEESNTSLFNCCQNTPEAGTLNASKTVEKLHDSRETLIKSNLYRDAFHIWNSAPPPPEALAAFCEALTRLSIRAGKTKD